MADVRRTIADKAAVIQQYFNKINITSIPDLVSKNNREDVLSAFSSSHTAMDSFTSIDQARFQRYREYEQMCYVPELESGLKLYADDASLYNDEDEVVKTLSDNQETVDSLHDLWKKSLDMNGNLWHVVYNTCKYGDAFYEIVPDNYKDPKRIKHIRYIPPQYVTRKEKDGNLVAFVVRIPGGDMREGASGAGNYTYDRTGFQMSGGAAEIELKPWQIVHFKLDDKEFDPYGKSVFESGRLAFKQMKLIEDAMLIYRISRAPERRVFKIPVGQMNHREAMQRVEDFKQKYRKTPWIDPSSGEINYKANPLSINDDFFIPIRQDGTGVNIDMLPGGQQLGEIDDVRYFKEKILRTMSIPISYLTGELQGDVAKTSLAAMDVRFAKTIERIQKMIIKGLEKIAIVDLAFKRFSIQDLQDFTVGLTEPSKIYEMQELETFNSQLSTIQSALSLVDDQGNLFLPREWLYKKVMKFNDQEISTIKLMQQAEQAEKQEATASAEGGEGLGAGGEAGGGMTPVTGLEGGAETGTEALPGEAGVAGAEAGTEGGGPAEIGAGEVPTGPAASGGEAALQMASQILNVASDKFLVENEHDIKELLELVRYATKGGKNVRQVAKSLNELRENKKITKDKPTKKRLYENDFLYLYVTGEFRGLINRKKSKHALNG